MDQDESSDLRKLGKYAAQTALGAVIPGIVSHQLALGATFYKIGNELKSGRKSVSVNLADKFNYYITSLPLGAVESALYLDGIVGAIADFNFGAIDAGLSPLIGGGLVRGLTYVFLRIDSDKKREDLMREERKRALSLDEVS